MPFENLISQLKEAVGLELEPIALRRVDTPPAGTQILREELPSACTFWRKAEHELFFATKEAHMGCPIGSMVMGFDLPKEKEDELMDLVDAMCSLSYLKEEEVPNIPKLTDSHSGVLYGPLRAFPMEPELVLLWATPAQAMLLREATGEIVWSLEAEAGLFGRPACAVLPKSLERGRPTLSMGCTGMRTFTEISEDRMLLSIPGGLLSSLGEEIHRVVSANQKLKDLYLQKKSKSNTNENPRSA